MKIIRHGLKCKQTIELTTLCDDSCPILLLAATTRFNLQWNEEECTPLETNKDSRKRIHLPILTASQAALHTLGFSGFSPTYLQGSPTRRWFGIEPPHSKLVDVAATAVVVAALSGCHQPFFSVIVLAAAAQIDGPIAGPQGIKIRCAATCYFL
jgi:hypothetical protein